MATWVLTLVLLAAALWAATEALWRWRIAGSRRDVGTVVLHTVTAGVLFRAAWAVGSAQ